MHVKSITGGGAPTTYPILIGDEIFLLDTFAHISANANFN